MTKPIDPNQPLTSIRHRRLNRDMSMVELAAKSGVALGTLSKLENSTDHDVIEATQVNKLIAIGEALGVTPSRLYERLSRKPKE